MPRLPSAVIGGLMSNAKTESESKIPFLGDIPLLGNLFKRKIKDNTKTELIIFLTPQIVRDGTQLASVSEYERGKAELQKKSMSEEELNKFLDTLPKNEPEKTAPRDGFKK